MFSGQQSEILNAKPSEYSMDFFRRHANIELVNSIE